MARYERVWWEGDPTAPGRRNQRSGWFEAYVPDLLVGRPIRLTPHTADLLRAAEAAVGTLWEVDGASHLEDVAPLLLSAESSASSRLEGIAPSARQVAFAELALSEGLRGTSEQARSVARNIQIMRRAVTESTEGMVAIEDLQAQLMDDDRLVGVRSTQNWIGGSGYHPLDADYVGPAPEHVARLLADLIAFSEDLTMNPLIQAGLAHAQLETIHPFPDGNGRVGRALIHMILARRRVTTAAVLPVSLVLLTRKNEYIRGLEAFRHQGAHDGPEASVAANEWLTVFLRAVTDAATQASLLASEVHAVRKEWLARLGAYRISHGQPAAPRADSAVSKVMNSLLRAPIMTIRTAADLAGVSEAAAGRALNELGAAGITTKRRDRLTIVHSATEILTVIDVADRKLASPVFDTSAQLPVRPVPARARTAETPGEGADSATTEGSQAYQWSDRARSVWGKTDRASGQSLSLVRHLEDSAAVAGFLWDTWLPANIQKRIASSFAGDEVAARTFVTWSAGLHDLGKASPGFAVKVTYARGFEDLLARMEDMGLRSFPHRPGGDPLPPHCHLGQFVLSEWLIERYGARGDAAAAIASPVGIHHGSPPSSVELRSYRGSRWTGRDTDAWRDVQDEVITGQSRRLGALDRLPDWLENPPDIGTQVLVSSIVVVADWLASDITRFPYDDQRPITDRLHAADLTEALRSPWRPSVPLDSIEEQVGHRFPQIPSEGIHPMQRQAHAIAQAATEPCLMVIEAPLGSGKTEAALLAAEELARNLGAGGIFIALPTMATADAMFGRVRQWARNAGSQGAPTTFLAHGKARLNEDYHVLVRQSHVRGINANEGLSQRADATEDAVVSSWLQGRRKGVLANLVVGTIDQVLFGALKSRHVALRHLAIASKVVIIDEVHAADRYMQRYLDRALRWLGAYGVSVILLSATLPTARLDQLTKAYALGRGVAPAASRVEGYPRLTVQGEGLEQFEPPWTGRQLEVQVHGLIESDLVAKVVEGVRAGGCVVVIRNTVGSAQSTYLALREALPADQISLLHSRLIASERAARERMLLHQLGPPGDGVERPSGHVVVGTQVLEQSLDIDADVMITDHAPADLLLQRMGRLHRHQRGAAETDRPESMREANLWLVGAPSVESVPDLDRGSAAVYGEAALLRSAVVFADHMDGRPVRMPDDTPRLVARAYDPDLQPPALWSERWEAAEEEAWTEGQRSAQRASTFMLAEPRQAHLIGWLEGRTGERAAASTDEQALSGHARVRDSEDSLEVILVWRDSDRVIRLLPGLGGHAGRDLGAVRTEPPPAHLALSVLASTVRLPSWTTQGSHMGRVIRELEVLTDEEFAGWQASPWLQGELVLCLDPALRASVGGLNLKYDPELGLTVAREVEAL